MLGHRLRCWPNIKTTLAQCLLYTGENMLIYIFNRDSHIDINATRIADSDERLIFSHHDT